MKVLCKWNFAFIFLFSDRMSLRRFHFRFTQRHGGGRGDDSRGGKWMRRTAPDGTPAWCVSVCSNVSRLRALSLSDLSRTHARGEGGVLWRRWGWSRLVPPYPSSVLLWRSRRMSATPTCPPTAAWNVRWKRRRIAASSTSAQEKWRSFPGRLSATIWPTRWKQVRSLRF